MNKSEVRAIKRMKSGKAVGHGDILHLRGWNVEFLMKM